MKAQEPGYEAKTPDKYQDVVKGLQITNILRVLTLTRQ